MGQGNLHRAKVNKNDEFYTRYEDVYNELEHYKGWFKDKWVFSNCDDYRISNFCKFFVDHFKDYGLKRYTAVCYDNGDGAVLYDYDGFNISILPLRGNGDFRSPESIELLKQCDVVVTNPPFSLFREYVAQLIEYQKYFLILGNNNAVITKEIFPLIRDNKMWLGYSANKTIEFEVPEGYTFSREENGKKYGKVPAITWFTNIPTIKRSEKLILGKHYKPEDYPKYDNYDAIEVSKVVDIPIDYEGVMGVPITFLDKYCPEQFEIVWQASGNTKASAPKEVLELTGYEPNKEDRGGCGVVDGKRVYSRILIKKKDNENREKTD